MLLVTASCVALKSAAQPPNVIVILCDDLGYADIRSFGCSNYWTYYALNELQSVTSGDGHWKLMLPHTYQTLGDRPAGRDGFSQPYQSRGFSRRNCSTCSRIHPNRQTSPGRIQTSWRAC